MVDYPNHPNVGDSAIWVGECEFLAQHGFKPDYVCEIDTYSKSALANAIGDGTIFIHGGGNFGDLWPEHQVFREQLLNDFPDNPIVQLPQGIHFNSKYNLQRTKDLFQQYQNFTLFVRDSISLDIAHSDLGIPAMLCPDLAFWCNPEQVVGSASVPCIWLVRNDKESAEAHTVPDQNGVMVYDWNIDNDTDLIRQNNELRKQYVSANGCQQTQESIKKQFAKIYSDLALERLHRGCQALARGRSVITERLHGHVFCLLLGIPHKIIDTRYGKIRQFIDTWQYRSPLINWP
ncbi:MAG: exopolysaccharide biosynthesis protein [marine bacterium B5-7]|nr:MAG: exopolysaccharide biosynthesis protein [marine bacterium B5-7]